MPDDLGYSAGERRYELLEKLAGNKVSCARFFYLES